MKKHQRLPVCIAMLIAAFPAFAQLPAASGPTPPTSADYSAPASQCKHRAALAPACDNEESADVRAVTFLKLYVNVCMRHVNNLDELRAKLTAVPRALPEVAQKLSTPAVEVDAWPVPDPHGHFLVAVGRHKTLCAVYARRVDTEQVKTHFEQLVSKAPPPLMSTERSRSKGLGATGKGETVFYKWGLPDVPRAYYFGLTTNPDPDADLQAHFSLTRGTE